MMMRPRSYSVLNRSIARGISYALRDNNRKKYSNTRSNNSFKNNSNSNLNKIPSMLDFLVPLIIFGSLILICVYPISIIFILFFGYILFKVFN